MMLITIPLLIVFIFLNTTFPQIAHIYKTSPFINITAPDLYVYNLHGGGE